MDARLKGLGTRIYSKIVRVIAMAIITAEVLSACGVRPEERESRAKEALRRKYDKEFEIVEVYPQKFGDLYYEVRAYAADEPDIRFNASIDTEDDGVSDEYVERRVCSAIAETESKNLDGLQGYYVVFVYALGPQPKCDDLDIDIDSYAKLDPLNRFRSDIFLAPKGAKADETYRRLSELLKGLESLRMDAELTVVTEEQLEDVLDQLEKSDEPNMDLKELLKDCVSVEIPYENGKIAMQENDFIVRLSDAL